MYNKKLRVITKNSLNRVNLLVTPVQVATYPVNCQTIWILQSRRVQCFGHGIVSPIVAQTLYSAAQLRHVRPVNTLIGPVKVQRYCVGQIVRQQTRMPVQINFSNIIPWMTDNTNDIIDTVLLTNRLPICQQQCRFD